LLIDGEVGPRLGGTGSPGRNHGKRSSLTTTSQGRVWTSVSAASSAGTSRRRQGRVAAAQRQLHHDHVHPAAMLEAHRLQNARRLETQGLVNADRPGIAAVADDGDQLTAAEGF